MYEMASKLKRYVIELMVENFPESGSSAILYGVDNLAAFFVGYDVEAHSMPARKDKVNSETHALTTETDGISTFIVLCSFLAERKEKGRGGLVLLYFYYLYHDAGLL